jgi:hypothetical protein
VKQRSKERYKNNRRMIKMKTQNRKSNWPASSGQREVTEKREK